MEMNEIILITEIACTSILAIISLLKGKKTTYHTLELDKQKRIKKLEKQHKATENKYIKEEEELKKVKENK